LGIVQGMGEFLEIKVWLVFAVSFKLSAR
jgi:hypothetical protein